MIPFFRKFIFFAILFLMAEFLLGLILSNLYSKAKSGEIYKSNHGFTQCNEDILFFGASDISHHIMSKKVEDSLKYTCFNLGQDGCGIMYQLPLLQTIVEKNKPKFVVISAYQILNVKTEYISRLFPYYYNNEFVKKIVGENTEFEKIKFFFKTYGYNSVILKLFKSILKSEEALDGYVPLYGKQEDTVLKSALNNGLITSKNLNYFSEFVSTVKRNNIPLIILCPPRYEIPFNDENFNSIDSFCVANKLSYYNFSKDTSFLNHPEIFKDPGHLNHEGAIILTNKFIKKFKQEFKLTH